MKFLSAMRTEEGDKALFQVDMVEDHVAAADAVRSHHRNARVILILVTPIKESNDNA